MRFLVNIMRYDYLLIAYMKILLKGALQLMDVKKPSNNARIVN